MKPASIAALLVAAGLAGCVSGPFSYATGGPVPETGQLAPDALAHVNAFRRANGLRPVRLDPAAMAAARAQSVAMAQQGSMSHSAGGDFRARLAASGVGRAPAVENIAWGQRSIGEAMGTWKGSSLHARNMLTPDMTRLGVAVVPGSNGLYWTLVMAGDAI